MDGGRIWEFIYSRLNLMQFHRLSLFLYLVGPHISARALRHLASRDPAAETMTSDLMHHPMQKSLRPTRSAPQLWCTSSLWQTHKPPCCCRFCCPTHTEYMDVVAASEACTARRLRPNLDDVDPLAGTWRAGPRQILLHTNSRGKPEPRREML